MVQLPRVLLIEDDEVDRMLFNRLVKDYSGKIEFFEAPSTQHAKQLLKNYLFDLIICDNLLPDGNVIDLLHHFNDIPFVITSGVDRSELKRLAKLLNASDYLPKPFRKKEIEKIFQRFLFPSNPEEINPLPGDIPNIDYLEHIAGNDDTFIIQMIDTLLKVIPQSIQQIKSAYVNADLKQMQIAAHKFKSNLKTIGCDNTAGIAERVEHAAKMNQLDEIDVLLNQLEKSSEKITDSLQNILQEKKSRP